MSTLVIKDIKVKMRGMAGETATPATQAAR